MEILTNLLKSIVDLYDNDERFRYNMKCGEVLAKEYILIVATYIFAYLRSMIKHDMTVDSLHVKLFATIFSDIQSQKQFHPFGYEFDFIQCLLFYSKNSEKIGS